MSGAESEHATRLHASTVAFALSDGWHAVLITGRSGAGKSELALELMAQGARLVADDQTLLMRDGAALVASAPDRIRGMIEMRGLGIMSAQTIDSAPVVLRVDLNQIESARLPELRHSDILGARIATLHRVESRAFPAALRQYMLSRHWLEGRA
ncbi:MAG: HPr kinase/phosphatase C-terminal domain-containing protein [Rhodobacteraceae bacterium]|nr:HPr kinase/phosphatase C-terminal domain-containing protein [Paracoccaceae bacterium]